MRVPADPDTSIPAEAKRQGISGSVLVEVTVAPDGRARNVRVWNSLPVGVFDEAGRRVALSNVYTAAVENGVRGCRAPIRFKVKFAVRDDRAPAVTH